MRDRTEILESALDILPDGIVLFGAEGEVVFWNQAAAAITGYAGVDVVGRPAPEALETLMPAGTGCGELAQGMDPQTGRGTLVRSKHKLGHEVQVMTRALELRDGLGERIGMAAVFHPAECLDALPLGETSEHERTAASRARPWKSGCRAGLRILRGAAFRLGVLWVNVDQAHTLRKTHGTGACEAMLEKVERALAQGLRPAEEVGRWGDDEFLIVSHERSAVMLATHGQALAGLARTADFRWWGDRVSLTVSIGAAQASAEDEEGLAALLERAQGAMEASIRTGGNCVTSAPGRRECLPS